MRARPKRKKKNRKRESGEKEEDLRLVLQLPQLRGPQSGIGRSNLPDKHGETSSWPEFSVGVEERQSCMTGRQRTNPFPGSRRV